MQIKRVLTIAGSDSGGGAGIQADLRTISALGAFGMSVITALTAQNTLGVQGIFEIPPEFVEKQFDSVLGDIGTDAAKTGMLSNSVILRAVAKKIREYHIEKLVVDPVMYAKGGAPLLAREAGETLIKELLPLASIATPNIPEAEALADMPIRTVDDMKQAAKKIVSLGTRNVLIKGGHLEGPATDILYDGRNFHSFSSERIATRDTHGTGCTYASAIATGLAQGLSVVEAVERAKRYVTVAIRFALHIGGGQGPTNHMAHLLRESERYACLEALESALSKLEGEPCGNIVPEVQSNLGYALPFSSAKEDVAAFPGRIIRVNRDVRSVRSPRFGASSHIARIILTAMRHDSRYRSAMNVRFSNETIGICRELGYAIESFDRRDEPKDIKEMEGSSLEWGTNKVLSRTPAIPDIIFDRGDVGKEPMIRILGQTPAEVVEKAIRVSRKLREF
jgi:hydroxymethylpyrimidine kinase/phosphomethylpyrimidine kinase